MERQIRYSSQSDACNISRESTNRHASPTTVSSARSGHLRVHRRWGVEGLQKSRLA
jgi:hypothetical protein